MNTKCNSNVSKALALGLANYLMFLTNYHFNLSASENSCYVTIFFASHCEMVSLEFEIRNFLVDGCTTKTNYLKESDCYTYEIEYPCVFSRGL